MQRAPVWLTHTPTAPNATALLQCSASAYDDKPPAAAGDGEKVVGDASPVDFLTCSFEDQPTTVMAEKPADIDDEAQDEMAGGVDPSQVSIDWPEDLQGFSKCHSVTHSATHSSAYAHPRFFPVPASPTSSPSSPHPAPPRPSLSLLSPPLLPHPALISPHHRRRRQRLQSYRRSQIWKRLLSSKVGPSSKSRYVRRTSVTK